MSSMAPSLAGQPRSTATTVRSTIIIISYQSSWVSQSLFVLNRRSLLLSLNRSLHGNQLTGTIPRQLSNLTLLSELYSHTRIVLVDPCSINFTPNLCVLSFRSFRDLSWNQLTGTIPTQLSSLKKLSDLYALNRIALLDN